jgi:hypothetical protein
MEKIEIEKRIRYLDAGNQEHCSAKAAFYFKKRSKRRDLLIFGPMIGEELSTNHDIACFILDSWKEIKEIVETEYEMEVIGDGIPAEKTDE